MQQDAREGRLFRATVAYDGTEFLGFQLQAKGRTVQGALESALAEITRTAVRVAGAGRTDSGVHARGQVIAFRIGWRHAVGDLQRAVNAMLPGDVAILELGMAPEGWHPRFSAVRRSYRYTVLNSPIRSPLDGRYAHHIARPLDLDNLQQGSRALIGVHDFAPFGQPTQGESTVREVFDAQWQQDGPWFTFDVAGNAFLRGMVRCMVGTLLRIGGGLWPVERTAELLESRNRALVAPPAPACGLCLMRVEY